MDAVLWPYPPAVGLPPELSLVADKVHQTGPFLDIDDVPGKVPARRQLGLSGREPVVLYAPRGFPFGKAFGHRVLGSLYHAVRELRRTTHPGLRLVLLAVTDPAELRGLEDVPDRLPDWVEVKGVVTPSESLVWARAADVLVAEGTSTIHEGAALGTPMLIFPGPIEEIRRVAAAMRTARAAPVIEESAISAASAGDALASILGDAEEREATTARARSLVSGGGGVTAAARLVLETGARHRAARASALGAAA